MICCLIIIMCHTVVTHYTCRISYNMTFCNLQSSIVMATGSVMYQFILDYAFTSYNLNYMIIIVKLTSIIGIQQVSYIIFLICLYKYLKKVLFPKLDQPDHLLHMNYLLYTAIQNRFLEMTRIILYSVTICYRHMFIILNI